VQLTGASASGYNTDPAFSPDGSKIAWVRSDGIWIMHADSTGEEWFADGEHPAWSPDGKRLAFVRADRKEADSEIFKKALGAARAKRVTDNRVGFEAGPAWSPYGSRIAFSHSQGGTTAASRASARPTSSPCAPTVRAGGGSRTSRTRKG
jgi:Tol biopolymer transport system component